MIQVDKTLAPADLLPQLERFWARSAECIDAVERSCPPGSPSPVFTKAGRYTAQGWTEWTQGFQFGSAILQFDVTGDERFLELGRNRTVALMGPHVTHIGVHDHGFNNVSTYGNLWRLMNEGRIAEDIWERAFYELALKASGAVQAARWAKTADGTGYIYSFNGPQSLFVDTIRTCRALALAHQLGHSLFGENDERINLLQRLVEHANNTIRYNIRYGERPDIYDTFYGRTAHESLFNTISGEYRAPSTQQGYSPFSTWTRGLAWAMLGYAELVEWITTRSDSEFDGFGERGAIAATFLNAALATCDFYIRETAPCGIPYWDTGAPGLARLGDYLDRPADPFNDEEPVDSSAAAIAAQGLLRVGRYLTDECKLPNDGERYTQAGLSVLKTLLTEPYLSTGKHEGLILHSVYHRPKGWDYIPPGRKIPCGEASMWGDYHARELALVVQRLAKDETYLTFFGPKNA